MRPGLWFSSFNDSDCFGEGGKHFCLTVFTDMDNVLNPDTAISGNIDAGLNGEYVARLREGCIFPMYRRGFVNFNADPMSDPIVKVLPVPLIFNHFPGGGIDAAERY